MRVEKILTWDEVMMTEGFPATKLMKEYLKLSYEWDKLGGTLMPNVRLVLEDLAESSFTESTMPFKCPEKLTGEFE